MNRATQLKVKVGTNPATRLSLLAPYDLELRLPECTVIVGRFSHGLLPKIRLLPSPADKGKIICSIGAFCEAADQVGIIVGGVHQHDKLFNLTFGPDRAPFWLSMTPRNQELATIGPSDPVIIGDNVQLAYGATVVSGAETGDGSIIGARALVTGKCGPIGVYGGVPAKRLRERFSGDLAAIYPQLRLGDIHAHQLPHLPLYLDELASGKLDLSAYLSKVSFLKRRPRLVMTARRREDSSVELGSLVGYAMGDEAVTDPKAITSLNAYFGQLSSQAEEFDWSPDIFTALGV